MDAKRKNKDLIISPPTICLLTVKAFDIFQDCIFNAPVYKEETPYIVVQNCMDIFCTASVCLSVEWFYRAKQRVLAWMLAVIPILVVAIASIIVVINRFTTEQILLPQLSSRVLKISNLPDSKQEKIQEHMEKFRIHYFSKKPYSIPLEVRKPVSIDC